MHRIPWNKSLDDGRFCSGGAGCFVMARTWGGACSQCHRTPDDEPDWWTRKNTNNARRLCPRCFFLTVEDKCTGANCEKLRRAIAHDEALLNHDTLVDHPYRAWHALGARPLPAPQQPAAHAAAGPPGPQAAAAAAPPPTAAPPPVDMVALLQASGVAAHIASLEQQVRVQAMVAADMENRVSARLGDIEAQAPRVGSLEARISELEQSVLSCEEMLHTLTSLYVPHHSMATPSSSSSSATGQADSDGNYSVMSKGGDKGNYPEKGKGGDKGKGPQGDDQQEGKGKGSDLGMDKGHSDKGKDKGKGSDIYNAANVGFKGLYNNSKGEKGDKGKGPDKGKHNSDKGKNKGDTSESDSDFVRLNAN